MNVLNIHTRIIQASKERMTEALQTLGTKHDEVWPKENWPAMKFREGMKVGSKGGHGAVRYTIETYQPDEIIQFLFSSPKGFDGIHKLELKEISDQQTQITHVIDMKTTGKATLYWVFAIRSLHDALLEDAFDKLENKLTNTKKKSNWSFWVRSLRMLYKLKK
ncbi:hypothetical protein [uncultured Kordia sp.]|uniref:hypothetical protein n=1 Tax=uncultured Kordia sp. TaxID=507699 RepID=UPI00261D780F|nr:hypothetical protein [uncultured Kordia sp.]